MICTGLDLNALRPDSVFGYGIRTLSICSDLVQAAHQHITYQWWHQKREDFDLFVSQAVINEAGRGDPEAAARRVNRILDLPLIDITQEAIDLADLFVTQIPLPQKATVDALHIALAVIGGMDYLLSWNCTHIVNAQMRNKVEEICRTMGYKPAVICTPEELMDAL